MAQWLGIAILVSFSIGLSLFMRLERRKSAPSMPEGLGRWLRVSEDDDQSSEAATYVERRVLKRDGGLLRKSRLVEQRRTRRASDDEIIEVASERTLESWREF